MHVMIHTIMNKSLEYFEVPFTSILAISFVSYADIELGMKLLVLAATFGYTIWKWVVERAEKKRQREKEDKDDKQRESK